ncbi:methylmalonyl Co-A mutase-associated GTPase MeaB [Gordonia hongkongensis]|uniref:Methylmalonyl Co-A mutase-associated GTPase MeaB n=4 Tax=Gordonia TaxID=2053 RepID=A0AAX3TCZ0_9ACTN|nr:MULTISPECIES: methylmalonyl Co-A mutase-associated GTPase MeaB [Gordonia]QIK48105.1 methylmalonyl Co-A mutase-associated GTPase MeaB [Gordonia terrae]MCX2752654.1 methylmalonyl Co-A mutase-associated GTPase MeaB [Gordonia sp. 4N]MDT0222845.1 methylmalonyl Co-A mutase-associated GTPase MeaB [Gordonia sp. AC31]OCH79647.1 ATPase/protein kinase [Gordonia sp. UCD-TK1]WFP27035.1 methylmalonyl Co-A mutase-associated GTPase MeaB [Gordonia hongkongensis]
MAVQPRRPIDVDALADAVLADRRADLARAITLVESKRADHRAAAQELLLKLTPHAGKSFRVGITGVPGVGKSTTIEALGMHLLELGHKVAVLAVDPSSTRTRGSILGDKTRMGRLSTAENAYIRPSPTSGTLGGVAKATRESIVLVEAAGFDVVLVETVGVGQSEVTVANMVDTFTFLTLARTGDSLQGIKKGVLELADVVVVNKADGKHLNEAKSAARELKNALKLIYPHDALWMPPVLTMSAIENTGVDEFWKTVVRHNETLTAAGEFTARRNQQQIDWTWAMVNDIVLSRLGDSPAVRGIRGDVEQQLRDGSLTPALAAQRIVDAFDERSHSAP